jgi:uncharacterized protein (TIGR03000 family)
MATRWFWSTAFLSLAAAGLLFVPPVQAQHGGHGGGGHGGGGHGGGMGGGHSGGGPGFGRGPGFSGGRGFSGEGEGFRHEGFERGFGSYPWYGLGYAPWYGYGYGGYYGSGGYGYPGYDYSYASPDSYSYNPPATDYQSFYPPDTSAAPAAGTSAGTSSTDARVRVRLPDPNAAVWVEGTPTRQRGTVREFESPPLEPERAYHYDIRARWTENGQTFDQTRTVTIHAGDRVTVDFMPRTDEGGSNRASP